MLAHLDDFCLWVCVLVDDMCKELEGHLRRGPEPECRDSELNTNCLIVECLGYGDRVARHMQAHRDMFPILTDQSRFNVSKED